MNKAREREEARAKKKKIWIQANKEEPLRMKKITMKSICMHSYRVESDKHRKCEPSFPGEIEVP
jgi:hypothetical protein